MSASLTLPPGVGLVHLPEFFELHHGGSLQSAQVAFEQFGPEHGRVVVVAGGISAGRHVASDDGWWRGIVGPGGAIDTDSVRVIAIDYLGGAGESTGAGDDPRRVPNVDVRDQARAVRCVLDALQIDSVHAFVGSSYGGMVGLAFGLLFPDLLQRLVVVAATERSAAHPTALRAIQRRIVEADPSGGLALARALAMTTYRSEAEFDQRFGSLWGFDGDRPTWSVERYLDARGEAFAERFCPAAFVCLSRSIDLCDVTPELIQVPTIVVGIRGDRIAPVERVRGLADRMGGPVAYREFGSVRGHDGFLTDPGRLGPILVEALELEVTP